MVITGMDLSLSEDDQKLQDLLTSAFEGGVSYWCEIIRYEGPKDIKKALTYKHIELPFIEGCAVIIKADDEEQEYKVTRETLVRGLEVLKNSDYKWHYHNYVEENWDAETADVVLQCGLFGEIVYG